MEKARRSAARQRLVEEICIPERSQARDGKRNHIKDGNPRRNGGLEFNILKVTSCERQAVQHVNPQRSIHC